jgi:hypothetical protein
MMSRMKFEGAAAGVEAGLVAASVGGLDGFIATQSYRKKTSAQVGVAVSSFWFLVSGLETRNWKQGRNGETLG